MILRANSAQHLVSIACVRRTLQTALLYGTKVYRSGGEQHCQGMNNGGGAAGCDSQKRHQGEGRMGSFSTRRRELVPCPVLVVVQFNTSDVKMPERDPKWTTGNGLRSASVKRYTQVESLEVRDTRDIATGRGMCSRKRELILIVCLPTGWKVNWG